MSANPNLTTCFLSSIRMVVIYLIRPHLANMDRGSNTRYIIKQHKGEKIFLTITGYKNNKNEHEMCVGYYKDMHS